MNNTKRENKQKQFLKTNNKFKIKLMETNRIIATENPANWLEVVR
jgi:hypothetical protein